MIQKLYRAAADFLSGKVPQPLPEREILASAGIVSHRGEHDNRHILENTFEAFDAAVSAGADGIECDIRWTRDLHPVICHDADLSRLFGSSRRVRDMRFADLQRDFPAVPSLFEFIARYRGMVHLMVEIKKEPYPDPARQKEILGSALSGLEPVEEYHFLSLAPEMFANVCFVPERTFLPVGEINILALSRMALDEGWGGILGHYYLIGQRRIRTHNEAGQQVGTGYIASENCLCREVNRGVSWIFTENAGKICSIRRRLLSG